MDDIKNFFLCKGQKAFTKDEEVIGIPIPIKGEMAIADFDDLHKIDLKYKEELTIPIWRVRPSSFKFLSCEETDEFLRRYNYA